MLRTASTFLLVSIILGAVAKKCEEYASPAGFNQDADWQSATSVYDFQAKDIHGNNVELKKYCGHVLIIVNVASFCGLTQTNYEQLEQLYEKYKEEKGLRILAFPSNQFANQEPGTSEEIMQFVQRYNVSFDMFEKIDVNGENAHPLWKWLKTQKEDTVLSDNTNNTNDIKWNFAKFIIDKNGKVVGRFDPHTEPLKLEATLKTLF